MSNHLVNDRFWDDSFVSELNSEQKLIFLYLITCPLNKYSGVFEIGLNMISFHTSIPKASVEKHLKFFSDNKKIFFKDGWICINNYSKHNKNNPNIEKSVKEQLKLLPEGINNYFTSIREALPKHCGSLKEALPKPAITSNINNIVSNKNIESNIDSINLVMEKFYEFNPGLNFGNKTQRKATEDLIKKFTLENLIGMVEWYKTKMSDKYCPTATTPLAFKEKIGDIKVYADKLKNNNNIVNDLGNI
ncbi:hypothetical protein [Methanoculleus sp.]|uniref:hypothetical protein n=1 Tax=Methanoculleus sp. TaxID=90427 RepID=UPI0025D0E1EE|nr:hypothetical protein [Methanoculleus sp.]MCK9320166.1 hypothetical protein [Methanoculleus sp.]